MGSTRADKGWAVKRARPSKKVRCSSALGLCLEMSLVFDFGQGLRCGLSMALPLSLNYGGLICFLATASSFLCAGRLSPREIGRASCRERV